jgi:protein kinase-like protein
LFLNKLCQSISKSKDVPVKRKWSADYRDTPLPDSPIKRKPDIVLIDTHNPLVTWRTVHAIAEITSQSSEHGKLVRTVVDKSYIILTTQADRVFVPILSIWGNHKFRLTVTDREGQLRSVVYELAGIRPTSLSLAFLRVIVGLCFADKQYVGYDPTMITDNRGVVESINCCGKNFKVDHPIYETQSLVGRATRVWQVEYEGKQFILKDAWVEKFRPFTEIQHLQHVAGVQGVPKFICGEDVMINKQLLSTGNIRGVQLESMRVRRRIVTSSIGSHISDFRTKRELISAFRDVVVSALNIFSLYVLLIFPFPQR